MLYDQHSIDMLLRGIFHRFDYFEQVWILYLLIKGLDDCILKLKNKKNKEKDFDFGSVCGLCFENTTKFSFWVSLNMQRKDEGKWFCMKISSMVSPRSSCSLIFSGLPLLVYIGCIKKTLKQSLNDSTTHRDRVSH